MVKGLTMKELNKYLTNSFAKLSYYAAPSFVDETPNRILIYGGCNDNSNKTFIPEKITNDVLEMPKMCRWYGVNDVFISSIIVENISF